MKRHRFYGVVMVVFFPLLINFIVLSASPSLSQETINVPATLEGGITFNVLFSGTYRLEIVRGAYENTPPSSQPAHPELWGWQTTVLIYKNSPVHWGDNPIFPQLPNPVKWDYLVGDQTLRATYEEAETIGKGKFVDIPFNKGDYLILMTFDSKSCFWDNSGGVILSFTLIKDYYWRGISRPDIEKKYYDPNHPPVFLLRDFEHKSHQYKPDGSCGPPIRGNLPIVAFGMEVPENKGANINTTLSVKIADKDIYNLPSQKGPYAERSSEILNLDSSLKNLSKVMNGKADIADGVATLTYSYGGNPPLTQDFKFKAKIPRFEGLYIFTQDANGYWDWEPYQGDLASVNYVNLLIHGWQTTLYPNFLWMYDIALNMKTQYPDMPVLGWFWQKESYDPIQPFLVARQVGPQAELLKNVFITKNLNPAAQVHFIGHSFGGFISLWGARNLLEYRQDSQLIYDGVNFKVTILDTSHSFPSSIIFHDTNMLLLSRGVQIENYFSEYGGTIDLKLPSKPGTNLDPAIINKNKLCGDHGAPPWYYFDNKWWNNPPVPRQKFAYVLPDRTSNAIGLLLFH